MIIRCKDCGRSSNRKTTKEPCALCGTNKKKDIYQAPISHIEKAIKSLGNDHVAYEVKKSLTIALNKLNKKTNKKTPMETMKDKAVNLNNEWWSAIEEACKQPTSEPKPQ